jgi:uncharacterized protein DUF4124
MNEIARLVLGVAALLLSGAAAAETFKCTDKTGKITYSNTTCKELGLKDAGEVRDRLNVNPAYVPPPIRSPQPRAPAPAAAPEAPRADAPADADPKKPERRCFTVQTAKGNVTRCNDKPEDTDKPE